jgi:hypothetical protein
VRFSSRPPDTRDGRPARHRFVPLRDGREQFETFSGDAPFRLRLTEFESHLRDQNWIGPAGPILNDDAELNPSEPALPERRARRIPRNFTYGEVTGHPLVLTINGKAEVVVQHAGAYQALLDRVEAIEGIPRGLADVKAGRSKPARQVFDRLRRKHGIPR